MIYLKRLIALALMSALLMSFSACKSKTEFIFKRQGIYSVSEENTDISFKATIGESQTVLSFTSPSVINGLTAIKNDGQEYNLKYGDINVSLGSFAVKTADDFFAAMETLEAAGVYKDGILSASVDGIEAKGIVENGCLTELYFKDGLNSRKYIITTEAAGWKTVQKQE